LQRAIKGEGIARAATVALWRNDRDISDLAEFCCQCRDPGSVVTIIVAQKDAHHKRLAAQPAYRS